MIPVYFQIMKFPEDMDMNCKKCGIVFEQNLLETSAESMICPNCGQAYRVSVDPETGEKFFRVSRRQTAMRSSEAGSDHPIPEAAGPAPESPHVSVQTPQGKAENAPEQDMDATIQDNVWHVPQFRPDAGQGGGTKQAPASQQTPVQSPMSQRKPMEAPQFHNNAQSGRPSGAPKFQKNAQSGRSSGAPKFQKNTQSGGPSGVPQFQKNAQSGGPSGVPQFQQNTQSGEPFGVPRFHTAEQIEETYGTNSFSGGPEENMHFRQMQNSDQNGEYANPHDQYYNNQAGSGNPQGEYPIPMNQPGDAGNMNGSGLSILPQEFNRKFNQSRMDAGDALNQIKTRVPFFARRIGPLPMLSVLAIATVIILALVLFIPRDNSPFPEQNALVKKMERAINNWDGNLFLECYTPEESNMIKQTLSFAGQDASALFSQFGINYSSMKVEMTLLDVQINDSGNKGKMTVQMKAVMDGKESTGTEKINIEKVNGKWYLYGLF